MSNIDIIMEWHKNKEREDWGLPPAPPPKRAEMDMDFTGSSLSAEVAETVVEDTPEDEMEGRKQPSTKSPSPQISGMYSDTSYEASEGETSCSSSLRELYDEQGGDRGPGRGNSKAEED